MATVDMSASTASSVVNGAIRLTNVVDFNEADAKLIAAGDGTLVATDIVKVLKVPQYLTMKALYFKVLRAATGTTFEANIGVGNSPTCAGYDVDGWDVAVSLTGTAGAVVQGDGAYFASGANGFHFPVATTVDVIPTTVTAITSFSKVLFVADCFDPTFG